VVSAPEDSPEAKRAGPSSTAKHSGSAKRRSSRGCSGRRGVHRTERERSPEAREGDGARNWAREAREGRNRRDGRGGSNGGGARATGGFIGDGRQPKGSVDGGGYQQLKGGEAKG